VGRSVNSVEAVWLSIENLFVWPALGFSQSGKIREVEGVLGAEETVKESLNNIAGAFARGVSGLTYGTSGCLEYGNTGNTVITPSKRQPAHKKDPQSISGAEEERKLRFAEAVLQALSMINNSIRISLISPAPVVMIKTSFPRTLSWICTDVSPLLNLPRRTLHSGTPRRVHIDFVRVGWDDPPRMTMLRINVVPLGAIA